MADSRNSFDSHSPQDADSKRKRDESGPQPRAKRNRYISIACNECKRRKIKCNGQDPCQRCGNLSLECLYTPNCCNSNFKDSQEFRQMNDQIQSLQQQVNDLYHSLSALRNDFGPNIDPALRSQYDPRAYPSPQTQSTIQSTIQSPPQGRSKQVPKTPHFQGPTSSAFNMGVARSSLQNMGIAGPEIGLDGGVITQDGTPSGSPRLAVVPLHVEKDPIWELSKNEAVRLCRVYEEEMGLMYPVFDIEHLTKHAGMLYTFIDAASRSGFMQRGLPGSDSIEDEDTDLLKVVLAIALVTEGGGKSDLGRRLFDNVSTRLHGTADIKGIVILILKAMYHFHKDDEGMAWRIIGLTARLCIEVGLHRAETYETAFRDETQRLRAIKIFWSVYVLDRRWSFGTGMPFALQDADIDSHVPRPDDSSAYLNCMIEYSRIGSKVWSSVVSKTSNNDPSAQMSSASREQIQYLDYQIIEWHKNIPSSLHYIPPTSPEYTANSNASIHNESGGRAMYRLRVILYLRTNQMRILIYRPALHSATSILSSESAQFAQTVVDVAKDTIRVLTHVNQTSDVYRAQQVCFNYFLLSALAVLFLAVSHAPAHFSAHCRDEFYMALDLVRGLSANSYVSKRLWKTIRGLKEVGPKLGLYARNGSSSASAANGADHAPDDAHSSAAMAMAGLAGHPVDESLFYAGAAAGTATSPTTSPNGMANELTSLFEAAGCYGPASQNPQQAQQINGGRHAGSPSLGGFGDGGLRDDALAGLDGQGLAAWSGNEEELTRIMQELF